MLSLIGFGLVILILAFEIWMGIAVAMGHKVHRKKSPGPFWFVVALHAFMGLALLACLAAIEFGWR